jgi:hypothetical protein
MTDPTTDAAWPSGFTVLSKAERETYPRHTLDALTIALEATKLAIEAANDAPRRASHAQPTVPQIFESWHAANLLVHEVFENLYAQARYVIGVIKPMVTPA